MGEVLCGAGLDEFIIQETRRSRIRYGGDQRGEKFAPQRTCKGNFAGNPRTQKIPLYRWDWRG